MGNTNIVVPKLKQLDVRLDEAGGHVVILSEGREAARFPVGEVAERVAKAILIQSKRGEEVLNAENIILDNAILLRAGASIGLSNHPKIREETAKEAVSNRNLRRYMPGGVRGRTMFGTPTIIKHDPPAKREGA